MKYITTARKFGSKLVAGAGVALVTAPAFADTAAITTAVNGAITDATTLGTAIVLGLFGIWAVFLLLKAKRG